ncbi:MAG: hypothetical protein ACE5IQ_03215 [Candidatus Methylomirabilales bacterium]
MKEFKEIAKVKIDRAGTIYLSGKTSTLEELKQEVVRLKQANGIIWYFRENPQDEPPAQAMAHPGHCGCKASREAVREGLQWAWQEWRSPLTARRRAL